MRSTLVIGALLLSSQALATGPVNAGPNPNAPLGDVNPYYESDHFQWTNYNDDTHLLVAYSATVLCTLALEHKFGMKRWQAALTSAVAIGMLGTFKEVFHDEYNSRTDTKMWWAGAAAGGLTVVVFQF